MTKDKELTPDGIPYVIDESLPPSVAVFVDEANLKQLIVDGPDIECCCVKCRKQMSKFDLYFGSFHYCLGPFFYSRPNEHLYQIFPLRELPNE